MADENPEPVGEGEPQEEASPEDVQVGSLNIWIIRKRS